MKLALIYISAMFIVAGFWFLFAASGEPQSVWLVCDILHLCVKS